MTGSSELTKRWAGRDDFDKKLREVYGELCEVGVLDEDKSAEIVPIRKPGGSSATKALVKAIKEAKNKKNFSDPLDVIRAKRELYTKVGLLEIDFFRNRHGLDDNTKEKYQKLFDAMNKSLRVNVKKSGPSFLGVMKIFAVITYLVVTAIPILMILPIRMLHPTLRKLGITNNVLPIDLLQRLYAHGYCRIMGVDAKVQGNPDGTKSTILFFQHGSNLDPFVITAFSPIVAKWIGKKSIFFVPIFGWLALGFGMIPIDRGNLKKAIKSLEKAKERIEKYNRSVAISPEGTRSTTGQLAPFKKGPFHLSHQTGMSVTPVLIQGAYELWPPGQMWPTPGDVNIRFLDPITPKEGESIEDLQMRVREQFLKNIPEVGVPKPRPPRVSDTIFPLLNLCIPAAYVFSKL